ncbi:actin-binding Rho-activating protein [Heptranchias perlo]|uniref:actin-binding Rho-activating protein n=1 Tax=Heptranchias perlo TaxID=212740 RepID=UPI00355A52D6
MSTELRSARSVSKAIRKFRCVSMVNSLTKNWQKWANEHSLKQKAEPSGWQPTSLGDEHAEMQNPSEAELQPSGAIKQQASVEGPQCQSKSTFNGGNVASSEELNGSRGTESTIRTIPVTKTLDSRTTSRGNELVSLMTDRFNQKVPEVAPKPFLGNRSPTRRRLCQNKASELAQSWELAEKVEEDPFIFNSSTASEGGSSGGEKRKEGNEEESKEKDEVADRGKRKRLVPSVQVRAMGDLRKAWLRWADDHVEKQRVNPFSDNFDYDYAMGLRLKKGDQGYGRPKEGTKSAERGERAQQHIRKEMDEMCFIIEGMGVKGRDGKTSVTFGKLFDRYVTVSDKVVGILMRARKHRLVDFQGEMLWKGEHDDVLITLTA